MNTLEMSYQPPSNSLTFRANLAKLVSPLRRVRPRVPFFELGAHRLPTLWSLYRGLLRTAPTDDIKFRIRMLFRDHQHLTGTEATKKKLVKGYKWLTIFTKAHQGDERLQRVLSRYSRLISIKRKKAYLKELEWKELEWQDKLRNRPILTGGFMRPTIDHGPLPRMKPQPLAVTMMILNRRKARQKRIAKQRVLEETLNDLGIEKQFEEGLQKMLTPAGIQFEGVFGGKLWEEWTAPIHAIQEDIHQTFIHDSARATQPYPPELLAQIIQARRTKITNKTYERERERRGEILPCTLKRLRKGPPAHILVKMNEEQKMMDKVKRSVSEVGYVGMVKRRLGMTLRDPDKWKMEEGREEDKKKLMRGAEEH